MNIRVPVTDPSGNPLMPTIASRARRWAVCPWGKLPPRNHLVERGLAVSKWSDVGVYYVQLVDEPSGYAVQPIIIGVDPGKRYTGIASQSEKATLAMFHLVLMGFIPKQGTAIAGVKEKMSYRSMLRRGRRGRRIKRNIPYKLRSSPSSQI